MYCFQLRRKNLKVYLKEIAYYINVVAVSTINCSSLGFRNRGCTYGDKKCTGLPLASKKALEFKAAFVSGSSFATGTASK